MGTAMDIAAVTAALDTEGHAVVRGLIDPAQAESVVAMFDDDARYRSTIDMARHGYGVGTYRYFGYPLPDPVGPLAPRCMSSWCRWPTAGSAGCRPG